MVEWLAGNRIRGTSAEKPALGLPSGSVGGWKEVGRTTLGSAGDTVSVGSLADKRYLMVLGDIKPSGNVYTRTWLNGDSGTNYATRYSTNGSADSTIVSTNDTVTNQSTDATPYFTLQYFANLATKEKLWINHSVEQETAGAGTAPNRSETVNKHAQTTNPISTIQQTNESTGDLGIGSEIVVLGWDPADTHTSNFWEELASVELGSAGDTLDSGTFTAKKYLWVQIYTKNSGTINHGIRYNSDTGSNYSFRRNQDGGSDISDINQSNDPTISMSSLGGFPLFANLFIINNASNEKLTIAHTIMQNTAGAGNAPIRREGSCKWANTSSQITNISVYNTDSGSYDTGSIIKVWGSD